MKNVQILQLHATHELRKAEYETVCFSPCLNKFLQIGYSNRAGDLSQVDLHPRGDPRFFAEAKKKPERISAPEIDDKPPGSFRKKSARGCMFMGNKQIKEIRFGKLGGSQSLFLSSRGARPFF